MIEPPLQENKPTPDSSLPKSRKEKMKLWLKRLGFVGFMFFFLKGLVWLAIFFGVAKFSCF